MSQNNRSSVLVQEPIQIKGLAGEPIMKNYNVSEIKNLLKDAKTALIAVPQMNVDSIGAALALAIALKNKNIDSKVYCPTKTDNNYSKLSGLELLTDTFASNDLVVSLSYPLNQIEKVSYNDDGGKLNLVVQTKPNSPKIENDIINIQNQSAAADISFMLGDESPLGDAASMVNNGNWVLITPSNVNKTWAKATLFDPDAPFSEMFTFLLPMLDLKLDMDSGKNLLIGLRVATQSFAVNVSPETFEAGAICLRATQPDENTPQPASVDDQTPIGNIEKTGGITPGQNKANPAPII